MIAIKKVDLSSPDGFEGRMNPPASLPGFPPHHASEMHIAAEPSKAQSTPTAKKKNFN